MMMACRYLALLFALSVASNAGVAGAPRYQRQATPFGFVMVDPLDVETATAEGVSAENSARNVLAIPDVRFVIAEEGVDGMRWDEVADGMVTYSWKFSHGPSERLSRSSSYLLRHEIGHDLFERFVVPKTREGQYGTDAPDWLDEMAAIAFEGSEQQLERRRQAFEQLKLGGLIPLSRLLTMQHPELADVRPSGTGQTFVVGPPSSSETIPFYLTIRAFYDFLVDRTGNVAIVSELARAFDRGDALRPWLLKRLGYADRAASVDRMNADFLAWLAHDPRYGSGPRP